jgi:superfamily II DNA or RNA helicase
VWVDVEALFNLVKELASPKVWSSGVELARNGDFHEERSSADERTFLLYSGPKSRAVRVALSEPSEIWQCDCGGDDDPCVHVIATIIAVRQSKISPAGRPLVRSTTQIPAHIRNCFYTEGNYLLFYREIHNGEVVTKVERSLASTLSKLSKEGGKVVQVATTDEELLLDHILTQESSGRLSPKTMRLLIQALSRLQNTYLNGESVVVVNDPVLTELVVDDTPQGDFIVVRESSRPLKEVFANGAALESTHRSLLSAPQNSPLELKEPLRLVSIEDSGLSQEEWLELQRGGLRYSSNDAVDLASRILPALASRVKVVYRTTRLTRARAIKPRLLFETFSAVHGDGLTVVPRLVYGAPAIAEVKNGKLMLVSPREVPIRDVVLESSLQRELSHSFGMSLGEGKAFIGEAGALFLKRIQRYGASGDAATTFASAVELTPQFIGEEGAFDVVFTAEERGKDRAESSEEGRASFDAVIKAFRSGALFVQSSTGTWHTIPKDWLATHGEQVARLLAARDREGMLPVSRVGEVVGICSATGRNPPQYFSNLHAILSKSESLPEYPLPSPFNVTLREYQKVGINWLGMLQQAGMGALLADDMGLGKTVQAMALLKKRSLIVVPTSVLYSWEKQLAEFRPSLTLCRYHGTSRVFDCDADVILTTYSLVRMEQELFQGEEWDVIIVDEAQTIRNPSSQVSEAVRRLRGIFKICLSGTPVENSLKDLWSQSDFLNPGLLGSYKEFSERFSDILEGDANDLPAQSNSLKAKQLRATVQPFILRRLKREVAKELPAKTEVVLECELTPEERKHYEALILSSRKEVVEKLAEGASPLSALELLLRLRQACCHTGLLPGISARSSSKVSLLMESLLASSAQGHRAIVFSQWTSLLDRVEPHLRDSQISFQRIDGSTSNRDKIVSEFQEEDGPGVLLLSLKAGGVGLTLTAADHVYILDPWWNPAVEDQASDRAHRIGQDKPVMVYRLVAQDTVEERVIELQNRKRALLAAAVGDTGEVSLSKDELLFLLEG